MVKSRKIPFLLAALLLAALTLIACGTAAPTSTESPAAAAATPASEAGITDTSGQLQLPAATATPAPWPVVQSTPLPSGGEIRWFRQLQEDPQFKVTMVAAGTAVAIDGPVPVGDVVAAGIVISYIWVASDAPDVLADAVVDGVEALKRWADARAAEHGQVAVHSASQAAAPEWAADPYLGYGQTSFDIQFDDGSMARSPDMDWLINQSTRHGVPMPEFEGKVGTESYEIMQDLLAASASGILNGKGDGRSDGSINLYLGKDLVETGRGAVVIQKVHQYSQNVSFVVLSGPLQFNAAHACLPGKFLCFGDGFYLDPAQLLWDCAWWASGRKFNGHATQPLEVRVSMGRGWDMWWARAKARYDPLVPIVSVPLPSITLDKIRHK